MTKRLIDGQQAALTVHITDSAVDCSSKKYDPIMKFAVILLQTVILRECHGTGY